jgi:cell wall-associated NlpC family hydrolase
VRAPGIAIVSLGLLLAAAACSGPLVSQDDRAIGIAVPPDRPAEGGSEPPGGPGPSRGAAVARVATAYLGVPYVWAGSSPSGFDCSGLVTYVFARFGVSIPHNAAQQYRYGVAVPRDHLRPGDLVFFNQLRHNGIYLGGGRFIHSTYPGGVKISNLDDAWFRTRWVGARRL